MAVIEESSPAPGGALPNRSSVTARQDRLVPLSLPAAELEAGARVRDHGRLRRVRCVEPAVTSGSVRVFFEDDPERVDWLRVNVGQMVTVWRGEFDG